MVQFLLEIWIQRTATAKNSNNKDNTDTVLCCAHWNPDVRIFNSEAGRDGWWLFNLGNGTCDVSLESTLPSLVVIAPACCCGRTAGGCSREGTGTRTWLFLDACGTWSLWGHVRGSCTPPSFCRTGTLPAEACLLVSQRQRHFLECKRRKIFSAKAEGTFHCFFLDVHFHQAADQLTCL